MHAKRIISWVLTIAIMLGLTVTGIPTAFAAEKTQIDSISVQVSGVETGKSSGDVTATVAADANYTVTIQKITVESETDSLPFTGTFDKAVYSVRLQIVPKEGYILTTDANYEITGNHFRDDYAYQLQPEEYVLVAFFDLVTDHIPEVDLTVTGLEKGKTPADVNVVLPAGAPYVLDYVQIYDSNWNSVTGTFGTEQYQIYFGLTAKQGNSFAEDVTLKVNGVKRTGYTADGGSRADMLCKPDFRTPITKVEITVPEIKEGTDLSTVKPTLAAGANCTMEYELSNSSGPVSGGTAKKDFYLHTYKLTAKEGYRFTEDTEFYHNGEKQAQKAADPTYFNIGVSVELRTPLDTVKLTTAGIKVGAEVADFKVTVPSDAKYKVQLASLTEANNFPITGKLQANTYKLTVYVQPLEGYCFDNKMTLVTLDGQEPDNLMVYGGSMMVLERFIFLGQPINKVELPAWPTIKAGDEIQSMSPVTGEKYIYIGGWGRMGEEPLGDNFENNAVYACSYIVQAAKGYHFADNVTVTVGGVKCRAQKIPMGMGTDVLVVSKTYPLGNVKIVDKIVLSGAAPTAGKAPGAVTSSGTGYKMTHSEWRVSMGAASHTTTKPGETFLVGEDVYLHLDAKTDGAIFDPNLQVWFNGKAYDPIPFDSTIAGEEAYIVINLGRLKAATNPDTGDEAPVLAMTVLTVASILGMGLVISRRKAV